MNNQLEIKDVISLILSLFTLAIPIMFFFISSPEEITIQTTIIFGVIILFILIGSFLYYIYVKWQNMNYNIHKNKAEIEKIRESLNIKELYNNMNTRIKLLEFSNKIKNRKAQIIDPRIIFWILLIILLLLFLNSIGFFNWLK